MSILVCNRESQQSQQLAGDVPPLLLLWQVVLSSTGVSLAYTEGLVVQ